MDVQDWALAALASWRLTSLIANERGPFSAFSGMRRIVGIKDTYKATGELTHRIVPHGFLPEMISCVWCLSLWVTPAVIAVAATAPWWVLAPFAFSTLVILLHNLNNLLMDLGEKD